MRPPVVVSLGLLMFFGCATPYAYRFDAMSRDDTEVSAEVRPDPTGAREILLSLTNHGAEPVQVGWTRISVRAPDGQVTPLRPDADLGWVQPGQTQLAHLGPFTLAAVGDAALANDGAHFELEVPITVHRERTLFRFPLVAHVQPFEESRR